MSQAQLPAGFVLDPTPVATQPVRGGVKLPDGFVLDAPQAEQFGYDPDSAVGGIRTAAGGFLEGVPIIGPALREGGNYIAAGVRSAATDETFGQVLDRLHSLDEAEKAANPWVDTGAQIAGGIAGSAPAVAAAPALFGGGTAAPVTRAVVSSITGAGIGAADGGVRGGAEGAVAGGVIGGALGAAGPVVGHAIGNGIEAVRTARSNGVAARAAGTTPEAVDVVRRSLAADGTANGIGPSIAEAGPRAMLADAGPATRSVLDTAIARAGPGAGDAADRIGARAAGATDDVNAALDQAFGAPQGVQSSITDIRNATQPARSQAYNAAYGTPIDYAAPQARGLEELLQRVPQSAVAKANNLMRLEGAESQQILANIADDGTVTFTRMPDVRQIDYITRALNDVSRAGDGAGALGGNTAEGRAYGNLSRQIRGATRSLVPEYGVALDTAAEPIARAQALEFGQTMLRSTTPRDEVEAFVTGLSDAELRSVRGGVRASIADALANVKRTVTDANVDARQGIQAIKDLSSDAAREKIAMILPNGEADAVFRRLDEAARSFDLRASVATNSRTFGRQAAERAVEQATAPNIIESAAGVRPVAALQGFAQGMFGTSPADQLLRQDRTWATLADLLTQPASAGQGTLLSALQEAAAQQPAIARQSQQLRDRTGMGLSVLGLQGGKLPEVSGQRR